MTRACKSLLQMYNGCDGSWEYKNQQGINLDQEGKRM